MKNVLEPEETLLLEMHLLHNARRTKGYSAGQNKQTQRNGISSISIIGTRHGAGWTVAALSAPAYVCPAMEASLHHLQRLSTGSTGRVGGRQEGVRVEHVKLVNKLTTAFYSAEHYAYRLFGCEKSSQRVCSGQRVYGGLSANMEPQQRHTRKAHWNRAS